MKKSLLAFALASVTALASCGDSLKTITIDEFNADYEANYLKAAEARAEFTKVTCKGYWNNGKDEETGEVLRDDVEISFVVTVDLEDDGYTDYDLTDEDYEVLMGDDEAADVLYTSYIDGYLSLAFFGVIEGTLDAEESGMAKVEKSKTKYVLTTEPDDREEVTEVTYDVATYTLTRLHITSPDGSGDVDLKYTWSK